MVREIASGRILAFLLAVGLGLAAALVLLFVATGRGPAARDAVRRHGVHLAVFFAAFSIYLANGTRHLQMDTQPAVFGALSLVHFGRLDLTPFEGRGDPPTPFERNVAPYRDWVTMKGRDGLTYSRFPPGSALACVPFAVLLSPSRDMTDEDLDFAAKRAGALAAALSVAVAHAALRRLGLGAGASIATVAYAFGTTLFSTASQDIWQHAPAMLGVAVALHGVARTYPDAPRAAALVGAGLAWGFISRPTVGAPAVLMALYWLARDRRRFAWLALGAAPLALFWCAYAGRVYGSPLRTGYDGTVPIALGGLPGQLLETFFNPSRGVLVFSPFLVLAVPGLALLLRALARRAPDDEPRASLGILALGGLAVSAIVAASGLWPGGWSYGYRTSSEVAILLLPPFALVAERLWTEPRTGLRRAGRALLVALVAASIGIHALEYAFPNDEWNAHAEKQSTPQIRVHLTYAQDRLLAPR